VLIQAEAVARHLTPLLQGLNEAGLSPHFTAPRRQIANLDELPIPDRSLVDYDRYNRYIGQVMVKHTIALQTARGCPYNCAYCSKIWGRKHVFRSARSIFEEMRIYYDMGVRRFSIFDDIFNVNKKNGERLFELIIKNNLSVQLFFPNGLRGDLLSRDYIDLLVEAGLTATALALETASPRLQKLIGKNLDLDTFRDNAEYFCSRYPQVILELFAIHGFPTETEAEARLTLDFIKSLKWLHFPYIFNLKVYPDTDMARLAVENGILAEDILRSEDLAFHEISPTSPFERRFTTGFLAEFVNDYFLSKERLLRVLPFQMKVMTRDEMLQKYDSYFPADLRKYEDLLAFLNIKEAELPAEGFLDEGAFRVPGLSERIRAHFPRPGPATDALRVLLLDLSQYFPGRADMLYDVVEPPLGAMYVMTYLKQRWGDRVHTEILKSRLDFDSYEALTTRLDEFAPQVIGIRSLTFFRDFFHSAAAVIRQRGFSGPIVAGGPYATRNARSLLQDRNIDLAVISEGEATFAEIVEKIMENGGKLPTEEVLRNIDGIAFVTEEERCSEQGGRDIVVLDRFARPGGDSAASPAEPVGPANPAYVIYTSGSTGLPKGVVVEHRNVVNVLNWFGQNYQVNVHSRVLQTTSFTFDPSVEQIFGSLIHGASLYLPSPDVFQERQAFRHFVARHGITLINAVPQLLHQLLGGGPRLDSLQAVISGGERLDEAVKEEIMNSGYVLTNHYGPTETTIEVLTGRCSGEPVSLGQPIANTACFILDDRLRLVPMGAAGELYIAGAGVARGYLNNPELTADRFINFNLAAKTREDTRSSKHETLNPKSQPLYRTGDMVRFLPSGTIEFLGRRDYQVKIRGFRVELGEIESQLQRHRAVKEAAVVDRQAENGSTRLTAYFVLKSDVPGVDADRLKAYLEQRLPDYMIPTSWLELAELPLTASGKLDRQALRERSEAEQTASTAYRAPGSDIERTLAGVWQQVLGRERIGTDENFFEIGGDSIKAIQIVSRLNGAGYKLKMGDLFTNPVIAQLAGRVERVVRTAEQGVITGTIPLIPSQREFFEHSAVDRHHYNQAVMLLFPDRLEEETVRTVFTKLQEHHDALRLTFREEDGEIIQTNHPLDYPLSLTAEDLRGRAEAAAELLSRINRLHASIDLENGPLMKLGLYRLDDGDRLFIVVHHLVADGISWRILFEDIDTLFWQYRRRQPLILPPKSDSFKRWADELLAYANSEVFLKERAYWQPLTKEAVTPIPRDFPESENLVRDMGLLADNLGEAQTDSLLSRVNQAFGTEINDILLTALGLAIGDTFGLHRFPLALEGHGREEILPDIDVSRTLGWFTSVYPVVLDVSGADDLGRRIIEVKETLKRVPNRGVGYGILKYMTAREHLEDLDFTWKPQVSFNYLGQFEVELKQMSIRMARESIGNIHGLNRPREYELEILAEIMGRQGFRLSVIYGQRQYRRETIQALLDNIKSRLNQVIEYCSQRKERELTPSDFDYKELSVDDLASILS
jgi:amino acid adenylation domain-containing protein/non-ribosomal peptide synthase protein (TIGR01720 family)